MSPESRLPAVGGFGLGGQSGRLRSRGAARGENPPPDQQAHQENPNPDHRYGHEQEDELLPAQLNFTK